MLLHHYLNKKGPIFDTSQWTNNRFQNPITDQSLFKILFTEPRKQKNLSNHFWLLYIAALWRRKEEAFAPNTDEKTDCTRQEWYTSRKAKTVLSSRNESGNRNRRSFNALKTKSNATVLSNGASDLAVPTRISRSLLMNLIQLFRVIHTA